MDAERWERFAALRDSALQTARAWSYKEHAMTLWSYRTRGWAREAWQRLPVGDPVSAGAGQAGAGWSSGTWKGLTAVVQGVSNARAESINAGGGG